MSFGELRSLLQRQPTQAVWKRACEILEGFKPHEFDEMVVPYVQSVTRRWPRELCVAPRSWVLKEIQGQPQPYWEVARVLNLSCEYLTLDQITRQLSSERLDHIEALYMDSNRGGAGVAQALASAPSLRELEVLSIGYNGLQGSELSWLASAPALSKLRELNLEGNHKMSDGLEQLSTARFLPTLERLDLRSCELRADHVTPLFKAAMPSLRRLKLDRNPLGDKGIKRLSEASLGPMQRLELLDVDMTNAGLFSLAHADWMRALEFLDLSKNNIDDDGVSYLIEHAELSNLKRLMVDRTFLTSYYMGRLPRLLEALDAATGRVLGDG